MSRTIGLGCVLWMIIAVAGGCSKAVRPGSDSAVAADVDHWTCAMHPSVRAKVPGHCPICGMELIPVLRKHDRAGPALSMQPDGSSPVQSVLAEFAVPVDRLQQIGVTYAEVKPRPLRSIVRAVGMLEPDRTRTYEYVAHGDGYVQELQVTSPGDPVKAGEPLMTIDSPDLRFAEQELVGLLAQRDTAASGPPLFDQLIAVAEHRLMIWNLSEQELFTLRKTRQPSDRLVLQAPFDGVVQTLSVKAGTRVRAGQELIAMIDPSHLWLWVEFYEDEVAQLKAGQKMQISLPAFPTKTFNGEVSRLSPTLDPVKRTVSARVDISNPDRDLRPGMFANAITEIDAGQGLAVPVDAVLPTGSRMLVFVAKGGGRLEPRFIRVARQFSDAPGETPSRYYQVVSGLNEGERVVASANFLIDAESQLQGALRDWNGGEPLRPGQSH
ncbi:MAG: efflux RND transporter periplasmic adaptor subunit [Verrucomicrobia bacterium]|nr:efflux RND transporter periplasmic adaptor subunit [Verrucomicrobiota bacterium]